MTEKEWLEGNGPMLEFLRGKATDRKLRLFACACCRRNWNCLWSGNIGQEAILTAERFADGLATIQELDASRQLVLGQLELRPPEPVFDPCFWVCERDIHIGAEQSAVYTATRSGKRVSQPSRLLSNVQALYLHDLFGPLLFHTITIDPTWLRRKVVSLAQVIYDYHTFDRMPILADALEAAGCENVDILAPCRQPKPHVRGCWVVDSILGKQ